ncbi:MAG: beta-ketoacyl-[acyl-carrier-protein] synthase family protein [Candidatus Omnitrophota bacterium]|nr:beta-ketoacyl-[acyl-carrier-protein] synthase family protein [Candidatus Omnitrophota bacterium]
MKNRVAITGLGAVTPIGIGAKAFWEAAKAGQSGVGDVSLFDATNYETKTAAEVKGFNPADFMLPEVFRKTDRFAQLGIAAARMAIEDARIGAVINKSSNNVPVIIGSGLGGSLFHEEQIFQLVEGKNPRRVLSSSVPRIAPNAVSAYIAMQFQLRGPNLTISTACSSGGNAIALAAGMIEAGAADIVITGGVECPITPFTYAAYQSLRVLSTGCKGTMKTPRPFDKNRDGFVLGEAAGILVLEAFDKAEARGANIYAVLCGKASNCGAYHMAAPDPSGEDAAQAMESALADAGVDRSQIKYINAHGTATKANDACEAKAIKRVFSGVEEMPFVSSTKSVTGHTIGAAGAIEAILTALAVKNDTVPPNMNCDDLDAECDLNVVRNAALEVKMPYALSNSFGFGSNNSVLVFRKKELNS